MLHSCSCEVVIQFFVLLYKQEGVGKKILIKGDEDEGGKVESMVRMDVALNVHIPIHGLRGLIASSAEAGNQSERP